MSIKVLGIDIAKNVFQLHGRDSLGRVVLEKRLSRAQLLPFVGKLSACRIGIEAGSGAHYWAKEFEKLGHEARIIPAQFVRPFVKANKNDMRDAEAICEAMTRPGMRFVPVKSGLQLEQQSVHRVRSRVVASKTALVNEIRGLLAERGLVYGRKPSVIRRELEKLLGQEHSFGHIGASVFARLLSELVRLDEEIAHYDALIKQIEREDPSCTRLKAVPGIGLITATALACAVQSTQFQSGRHLAAWIGLVPRQHSSGGRSRLLGISKRGNPYLRTLLIHGARSVVRHAEGKQDRTSLWIQRLVERRGKNRAAVAVANKNARMVWAMLSRQQDYRAA